MVKKTAKRKSKTKATTKRSKKAKKAPKININMLIIVMAIIVLAAFVFYSKDNVTPVDNDYVPTENATTLFVVSDSTCNVCDTVGVVDSLQQFVINDLEVIELNVDNGQAKDFIDTFQLETLPAFIFANNVQEAENYTLVKDYLEVQGDYSLLRTQGNMYINREEIPDTIDLMVMSLCPYGTLAEGFMEPVVEALGDQIDYNLHFIVNEQEGEFVSLHGQPEVEENIRQGCVEAKSPEKFLEYLTCYNANYQADGQSATCIDSLSLNEAEIETCVTSEEGANILREKSILPNALGVGGSPTFLINNRYIQGGLMDSNAILATLCNQNPALDGCDTVIQTDDQQVTDGAC